MGVKREYWEKEGISKQENKGNKRGFENQRKKRKWSRR